MGSALADIIANQWVKPTTGKMHGGGENSFVGIVKSDIQLIDDM